MPQCEEFFVNHSERTANSTESLADCGKGDEFSPDSPIEHPDSVHGPVVYQEDGPVVYQEDGMDNDSSSEGTTPPDPIDDQSVASLVVNGQVHLDQNGDHIQEDAHTLPPSVYDPSVINSMTPLQWVNKWKTVTLSRNERKIFHQSGLPDDVTLLELLISDPNYHQGWHVISDVEKSEIRLMHRLNKIRGCPLFVYDAVREWASDNLYSPTTDDADSDQVLLMMKSREQIKREGPKFAHTLSMKPKTTSVPLPGCGKSVDITTMSYHGNLYNLLTSTKLVNDRTLLLNGNTPYADPVLPRNNVQFNDFNTGTRYVQAWGHMKKSEIDFPIGDVLFVDKSNYDFGDRLTAEPVMHTSSLIRCSARNQSDAWYNLGTVPSFKSLIHNDTCDKMRDYHKCLEHIFSEYVQIQKTKSGILWPLRYKGKYYMVRLRPYMLTCLGDTPGQNVLAGKSSGNRKCRYCDVVKDDLGNPWVVSNMVNTKYHDEIIESADLCKEYGYVQCPLVWSNINFGNDASGIHGNLPGEILHAYEKGLMVRVLDGLVSAPKMSQAARIHDKRLFLENVMETEEDTSASDDDELIVETVDAAAKEPTQEDLIKRGVFGGGMGKMVSAISVVLGAQLAHQSERDICRTYFPQGIMVRSKMTASEQQGLTLLFAMIISSTWSLQSGGLRDHLGDGRVGGYVQILESLMCLEELFKIHPGKSARTLMKKDIPSVSSYTKMIMSKASKLVNRTTGDGFNLIKNHLLTHMIDHDIYKYGLPRNTSGSPGECQFKKNMKLPGSTTQKRDYSFDRQVAERRYEHLTITRCMQRIERSDNHYLRQSVMSPMEDHFGSVMRNNPEVDTACTSSDNTKLGISEPMYTVLRVIQSSQYEENKDSATLDIVFKGKLGSDRAAKFPRLNEGYMVGVDGKDAGSRGLTGLALVNESFQDIVDYLKPVFDISPDLRVEVFTMLKVKKTQYQESDVIYRADPYCHLSHKKRHDWALIEWEELNARNQKMQVPAEILGFIEVDDDFLRAYNSSLSSVDSIHPKMTDTGQYAFIISLVEEIPALMDPTITEISYKVVMQSNSVLFFWGEQETTDIHTTVKKKGRNVKTTTTHPVVRLVDVSNIVRPLIVVPDFSPTFSGTKKGVNIDLWVETQQREFAWIILRPRDQWHIVYLELAAKHHRKLMTEKDSESELESDSNEETHQMKQRRKRRR